MKNLCLLTKSSILVNVYCKRVELGAQECGTLTRFRRPIHTVDMFLLFASLYCQWVVLVLVRLP